MENCFGLSLLLLLHLPPLLSDSKHFSENVEHDANRRPGCTEHGDMQIDFNGANKQVKRGYIYKSTL